MRLLRPLLTVAALGLAAGVFLPGQASAHEGWGYGPGYTRSWYAPPPPPPAYYGRPWHRRHWGPPPAWGYAPPPQPYWYR